jgi:two-component system, chemotaxis family, chemotaxis protein CheY
MSMNVLIVDDSGVMRAMILKTLRLSGLPLGEIFQASNGQEGLDLLAGNWIDLVMVDINMPVMNGEEMIARMMGNPEMKDIPKLVVSTEGSEKRIRKLQEQGAKFIHKPFTPEMVRDTIQEMLGIGVSDE